MCCASCPARITGNFVSVDRTTSMACIIDGHRVGSWFSHQRPITSRVFGALSYLVLQSYLEMLWLFLFPKYCQNLLLVWLAESSRSGDGVWVDLMVKMLTLVKDRELVDARLQPAMEDQELEDSFQNLYLDEESIWHDLWCTSVDMWSKTWTGLELELLYLNYFELDSFPL